MCMQRPSHSHTYTHMHTCKHMHTHRYTQTHIDIHTCTHHIYVCTCSGPHRDTRTETHNPYTRAQRHTCVCSRVHIYTHMHASTHMHTYAHTQRWARRRRGSHLTFPLSPCSLLQPTLAQLRAQEGSPADGKPVPLDKVPVTSMLEQKSDKPGQE